MMGIICVRVGKFLSERQCMINSYNSTGRRLLNS